MKQTIKLFLDEAPLWLVFIAMSFAFTIICLLTVVSINLILSSEQLLDFVLFKLSVFSSTLVGMFATLFTSIVRESQVFWEEAAILECKIDDADDKDSLLQIYTDDFEHLKHLSCGSLHNEELKRLYTIIKTKYKFVK